MPFIENGGGIIMFNRRFVAIKVAVVISLQPLGINL